MTPGAAAAAATAEAPEEDVETVVEDPLPEEAFVDEVIVRQRQCLSASTLMKSSVSPIRKR